MGLIINSNISAIDKLREDGIFIVNKSDKKYLPKVLILNLMPTKSDTEYQLLKLLGRSFVDVEVEFLYTKTYKSKNTKLEYLERAYKTLDEVRDINYDGMIITGAPLEFMDFEEIKYWKELEEIMNYSSRNIKSTIYLCWGAVAGLYYHYQISKNIIPKKVTGIFQHRVINPDFPLVKSSRDSFIAPHSRYFEIKREDIDRIEELEVLLESEETGIYIIGQKEGKEIYITGHPEYDRDTLGNEYRRDLDKKMFPELPKNYFPKNDTTLMPEEDWGNDSQLLIDNWIKYYLM
jgi:homoserine O-succinyltransferase